MKVSTPPLLTTAQFQRLVAVLVVAAVVVAGAATWLSPGPLASLRDLVGLAPTFLAAVALCLLGILPLIVALRRISDLPPLAADLRAQWEEVRAGGGPKEVAVVEMARRAGDPTWYLSLAVGFAAVGAVGALAIWDAFTGHSGLPVVALGAAVAGALMPPILLGLAWQSWRRAGAERA